MAQSPSFEDRLKDHLTKWARDPSRNLHTDGEHGWVLAKTESRRNYYREHWADLLDGKRHQWAHALNSSQAFAVNLFAPAKESTAAFVRLWAALWPKQGEQAPDSVSLDFEFNGPGLVNIGRDRLGEDSQTTQIDVALCATFPNRKSRFILIEVKLRETEFGACRGADAMKGGAACLSLGTDLPSREMQCYMTTQEGRRYWKVLQSEPMPLRLEQLRQQPCPWRGSLYQIMRNWAFGQALVQGGLAESFKVGICVHPKNDRVMILGEPVAGFSDAFDAFNALAPDSGLIRVEPWKVVDLLEPLAPDGWGHYMRSRYTVPE